MTISAIVIIVLSLMLIIAVAYILILDSYIYHREQYIEAMEKVRKFR
jgi:hypothetical protein